MRANSKKIKGMGEVNICLLMGTVMKESSETTNSTAKEKCTRQPTDLLLKKVFGSTTNFSNNHDR